MRRCSILFRIATLFCFALASSSINAQQSGCIVGWGSMVIPFPESLDSLIATAGGDNHSLGLKSDGTIIAWGYNGSGECNVPEPNGGFIAVAAGGDHSLGLKSDGTIVAWGKNSYGQCNVPSPNENFVAIAAGEAHSLGLKADGTK